MWSNKKICSEEKMYLGGLLSLVFSVLSTYFILRYLAGHYSFNVDLSNIGEIFAITSGFCPEPRERMLFMGGCLIMPAALYLFCNIFSWVLSRVSDGAYIRKVCGVLYFTVITLVYIMILVAIQENNCFFLLNTIGVNPQSLILISAGVFILFWAILFAAPDNKFALAVRLIEWSLLLLSLISILSVCLFCVFGTSSVSIRGVLDVHFNAVFHPVVQVYQGKTLLIDLLSQYGLYPHFLEPILKITGLTVLRFTVVMGALMALSLILIYRFLMGVTRNKIIGYLGFLSMIYYSYHFGRVISIDPYFQYNPIRFLFPAASVYLVYKYFKTNSKKLYYCLFALFSIALLWNFDTGIVVFLGWILVILFQELFKLKFRNIFRHLISGTIVFMAILSLFTVYLYIRSGQLPDYRAFLTHQNLFYLYGYGMMPMRMIHPWNMVILLYVIGLVISFASLCYARKSLKVKMIFFLSILGVGLFLYYQGRSHDLCLLPVSFPAIILMTIYADSMFCRIKLRNRFNDELVFAIMLSFMLFAGGSLLKNSPFIYKVIKERLSAVMNKEVNFVTQAAEFVKDNTGEGEEVLILSNLSGVYYLESGAVCPLQISGTTEIFLVEEYQKIYEFLGSEEVNKLIVDKRCHLYGPIKDRLSKYKIINTSPDGCHVVYLKE